MRASVELLTGQLNPRDKDIHESKSSMAEERESAWHLPLPAACHKRNGARIGIQGEGDGREPFAGMDFARPESLRGEFLAEVVFLVGSGIRETAGVGVAVV